MYCNYTFGNLKEAEMIYGCGYGFDYGSCTLGNQIIGPGTHHLLEDDESNDDETLWEHKML